MIRLGITGGIGSGKSVVSKLLRIMDVPVYDSDTESKRLTVQDATIRQQLIDWVGPSVYLADGSLNKPYFASCVFSSSENASKANAIIHPVVKRDFLEWAESQKQAGHQLCAIESAILYEAKFEDVVEAVIMVSASLDTRIQRTMQRDGASYEVVMERIKRQMDDAEKIQKADFVVYNEEDRPLIPQLSEIIASLFQK
ncbi:MAG: dephospho-CoA kinase [Bacteroidaceae bacterium]|nr:dephospho-CoA kinase [Bacteroidaceae bacterium]